MAQKTINGANWINNLQANFTELYNTVHWTFVGHSGAGACTLTGAKVGDVVASITGEATGTAGDQSAKFESTISVADQIQQSSATDLSANVYMVRLIHIVP